MERWSGLEDAQEYGSGILRGSLTYLRELREDDLAVLERWWADPSVAVFQTSNIRPQPAESVAEMIRGWCTNKDPGAVGFCVASRADDRLIGHAALHGATVVNRTATMAMLIGAEHSGKGFGTDATRTLVRYGFEEMGLHRIGLEVWSFNTRALATYTKAGFVEEGRRREVVFHGGRFYDEVLMSLLATEWRA
jgi:RimJ/RimL family protein N-acetyltransferase